MTQAKLKAKIGTIGVGSKNVKIVLEVSKQAFFKNANFFQTAEEEVDVTLGDLQASMEDYGIRAAQQQPGSFTYQADQHGVVHNVSTEAVSGGEQEPEETGTDESETEEPETEQTEEDFDVEFDETEPDLEESEGEPTEIRDSEPAADVQGKDEVENFILSGKAPSYDDLPHDFKTLLTRKRSGETWLQVAGSLGMHSGELSRIWNEYKKRVKAYLNGEEHGAA